MYKPKITHHFALEQHTGAYETWPLQSRLVVDGIMHPVSLPGYMLLNQFEIPDGYLLVTDFYCPFEETTCFVLLNHALEILATRSFGAMYCSFMLDTLSWVDERNLVFSFVDEGHWQMRIISPGAYFQSWRITAQSLGQTIAP
jgi:hypothetical protein